MLISNEVERKQLPDKLVEDNSIRAGRKSGSNECKLACLASMELDHSSNSGRLCAVIASEAI